MHHGSGTSACGLIVRKRHPEFPGAKITDNMPNKIERSVARVFLVDDHALVRANLKALIEAEADLAVCGEAEDAPTALALIRQQQPDLVVLDDSLKRSSELNLLKELKGLQPKPTVLVLSMHEETFYAERALQAGAMGYITKEEATFHVLTAVRQVLAGRVYLSERTTSRMVQKKASRETAELGSPLEVLTGREWEVFRVIGRGMATQKIAEELRLGIKTVESYQARIREKLRLADGDQLTQCAIQWSQNSEGKAGESVAREPQCPR